MSEETAKYEETIDPFEVETSQKSRGLKRRVSKQAFVAVIKAHTKPDRPRYAALARALSKMIGMSIVLAEPTRCPSCGTTFVPWSEAQTHCSIKCSNRDRQRRHRARANEVGRD